MDNLLTRHRNVSILVAVLFAQILGLAVQVKRSGQTEETRLIRVWAVSAISPFEKAVVWTREGISNTWHNYVYLRGVRAENRELKQQIEQMRLEQVRLSEDAEQARRLQLLLGFKEKFIAKTVAAQVIGSSGSEQSRSVYIDKGFADGVKPDQAVITADGIVGKVIDAYQEHTLQHTAKVLLVNDQSSGVGVILEKSRLQGILKGTRSGELAVEKILSDESVSPGERVLTSGGDQIFPKGLYVGTVTKAGAGSDSFLNIRLKPAANLSQLEEVLVVTEVKEKTPNPGEVAGRVRAVDILTQRLPSVPEKPSVDPNKPAAAVSAEGSRAQGAAGQAAGNAAKPAQKPAPPANAASAASASVQPKPAVKDQAQTIPGLNKSVEPTGTVSNKPANARPSGPTTGQAASGTPNKPTDSASATSKPASPTAGVKATAATGTGITPTNNKPAVVQKPATSVAKTAEKSAPSVPAQPKPAPAPTEENPQ
jgi:rod shape-determining protein MreC